MQPIEKAPDSGVWDAEKAQTPGAAARRHFDHCGAALMPQPVLDRMRDHLELEATLGGYVAQERVADHLARLYDRLADIFGGAAYDYALTQNASEGWAKLFYSLPMKAGDKVITAYSEYCSNFIAIDQRVRRDGIEVVVIGRGADGHFDLAALEAAIDDRTRLIALTHISSSSGEILPAAKVGAIARRHQVPFLLDACQSAGHVALDFKAIGCSMATATARKFLRGPRGVGFLYVDAPTRALLDPVMLTNNSGVWAADNHFDLRQDATLFESWERNVTAHLGFLTALDHYAALGPDNVEERLLDRARTLRHGLYALPHVTPACPPGAEGAIVTFNLDGWSPSALKAYMDQRDIGVQVASVVHTRLDLGPRGIESAVRVSPHVITDDDDISSLLGAVMEASLDPEAARVAMSAQAMRKAED